MEVAQRVAEERLLTVRDLVKRLAVSRSTVMVLLGRGDLPSLTIRRARRVRESALCQYIEARAAAAVEEASRHE